MNTTQNLLILGASTRAAAFSALRAGVTPRCVDYFADRDLAAACQVQRVDWQEGAEGLERAARQRPGDAWIFAGPLENHPETVERLSKSIPLVGTGPDALKDVRNPIRVAEVLHSSGLDSPQVRLSPEGLPRDGTWMVKPLASGGGRLVRALDEGWQPLSEPCYFQRRVNGPSFSALYMADRGAAELIGVTKQLVGAPGSPFGYHGSIGPHLLSENASEELRAIGQTLASSFAIAGWFGVDYILNKNRPWPVEVNPRYVASIEVLELATGRSLLSDHFRACVARDFLQPAFEPRSSAATTRVVGKAILYARRSFVAPDLPVPSSAVRDPFAIPEVADVPRPGTRFAVGEPVLTVLTSGADVSTCEARLRSLEDHWRRKLQC